MHFACPSESKRSALEIFCTYFAYHLALCLDKGKSGIRIVNIVILNEEF